jgi:hypothetical protein
MAVLYWLSTALSQSYHGCLKANVRSQVSCHRYPGCPVSPTTTIVPSWLSLIAFLTFLPVRLSCHSFIVGTVTTVFLSRVSCPEVLKWEDSKNFIRIRYDAGTVWFSRAIKIIMLACIWKSCLQRLVWRKFVTNIAREHLWFCSIRD